MFDIGFSSLYGTIDANVSYTPRTNQAVHQGRSSVTVIPATVSVEPLILPTSLHFFLNDSQEYIMMFLPELALGGWGCGDLRKCGA